MINKINQTKISFNGKSFKNKAMEKLLEQPKIDSLKQADYITMELIKNYAPILNSNVLLTEGAFGYKSPKSIPLPAYKGPIEKQEGFSTEHGGYGGGWLKASSEIPLSTSGIHSCALVHLVDDKNNEQCLYHVHVNTSALVIYKFIREKLPHFTKANIVPGDLKSTNFTVNNILLGINRINPKAPKSFFHFSTSEPEVVAHKGTLGYMPNQKPEQVSFQEVCQYHSGINI